MSEKEKIMIEHKKLKLKIAFLEQRVSDLEPIIDVLCKIHMDHNACMQFLQKLEKKQEAKIIQEDRELAQEAKRLRHEEIIKRRKQKAAK